MRRFRSALGAKQTFAPPITWVITFASSLLKIIAVTCILQHHLMMVGEWTQVEVKTQRALRSQRDGPPKAIAPDLSIVDHFLLLQQLSLETQDETCRLSQRPLAPGSTSFVSETLIGATDLEDVMQRVARAYNMLHGGTYNRVESRPDRLVFRLNDAAFPFACDPGDRSRIAIMEGVTICVHAMLSMVMADDITPWLRVVHTRRPTVDAGRGEGLLAYWRVPVRRGSNAYLLEYSPRAASLPVRRDLAPFTTHDVYARIIASAGGRSQAAAGAGFLSQVRRILVEGDCCQTSVSGKLGLSVATLRRRLRQNNSDFRTLRSEVLADRAVHLLAEGWPVSDVADALGFSDTRSFSRAFKSWHSLTPATYRQMQKREPQTLAL